MCVHVYIYDYIMLRVQVIFAHYHNHNVIIIIPERVPITLPYVNNSDNNILSFKGPAHTRNVVNVVVLHRDP
jgi:hypothetical protein